MKGPSLRVIKVPKTLVTFDGFFFLKADQWFWFLIQFQPQYFIFCRPPAASCNSTGEFLAMLFPPMEDIFEDASRAEGHEELNSPLQPREHWNPSKPVSHYLAQMKL